MAFDTINIGTVANDGTGDTVRDSFDKVNDNFLLAVEGPAAAVVDNRMAVFDGVGGRLVKQAAFIESDVARLSQAQTFTGVKTFNANVVLASTGSVSVTGTGALGYGTGSGGAVTQATGRTTGVTLNKTNGSIELVSAAGDTSAASFTVTNSTVAATDTVVVSQKSGTDKYIVAASAVAAGSFEITFRTFSGTTTEQPVFNFAVVKAVVA